MKRVTVYAGLVPLLLVVGCAQKQRVRVIFLSDPPGGTLYTQNDEIWGSCPKALWYDIDSETMKKGSLDVKGMVVRWATGPEKRSDDPIRITVDGSERHVVFLQPEDEPKVAAGALHADSPKVAASAPRTDSTKVAADTPRTDSTKVAADTPRTDSTEVAADTPRVDSTEVAADTPRTDSTKVVADTPRTDSTEVAADTPRTDSTKVAADTPRTDSTKITAGTLRTDRTVEPDKKAAEQQKASKSNIAENKSIKTSSSLISRNPVVADKPAPSLPGRTLTLAPEQLMRLDLSSLNRRGARVQGKRVVPGPGVEFDIYFPSNRPGSCALSFVSSGKSGKGTLVGADIRVYEAFALKLTLVSINGKSDPDIKQKLVAGAVIGPTAEGRLTGYKPIKLSLAALEKTVTAITPVSADEVYEIGFHVHVENHQNWDAAGSRVVLKIEPVKGGEASTFKALTG